MGYFMSRPISIVLVILIIAALFLPKIMKAFNKKVGIRGETSGDEDL